MPNFHQVMGMILLSCSQRRANTTNLKRAHLRNGFILSTAKQISAKNNSSRIFQESWEGLTSHPDFCAMVVRQTSKPHLASVCQCYTDYVIFVRDQERCLKESRSKEGFFCVLFCLFFFLSFILIHPYSKTSWHNFLKLMDRLNLN